MSEREERSARATRASASTASGIDTKTSTGSSAAASAAVGRASRTRATTAGSPVAEKASSKQTGRVEATTPNGDATTTRPAPVATPASSAMIVPHTPTMASLLQDRDVRCRICHDRIREAFMTRCGHTFCFVCLTQHFDTVRKDCPTCNMPADRESVFPNFALNQILTRHEDVAKRMQNTPTQSPLVRMHSTIITESDMTPREIDDLMGALVAKKRKLEESECLVEAEVLRDFLVHAREQKEQQLMHLSSEIKSLDEDLAVLDTITPDTTTIAANGTTSVTATSESPQAKRRRFIPSSEQELFPLQRSDTTDLLDDPSSTSAASPPPSVDRVSVKKRRVHSHFDDLLQCYFDTHRRNDGLQRSSRTESMLGSSAPPSSLTLFRKSLTSFTRFSRFQLIASLRYNDLANTTSIVSSIEFDRKEEYFATSGVTRKIKIFEYGSVLNEKPDVLFPIHEMVCASKISCLSWNKYIKTHIASSDYDGCITLWDAYTGQNITQFDEHEKRAWSVDFARSEPTRLASGSDDCKVKIWSTNEAHSVMSLVSKANVCSVAFNPANSNCVAYGSADHHIHYVDLRNPREPLGVFKGHKKAVSYVKFLNGDEIVSASTDSTLKLWNLACSESVRTFTGHTNEKNFVGLSVSGDFFACGSENNSVYSYYKALSKPLTSHKFAENDDPNLFVSSVYWKTESNVVLAANSRGTIKVLELIE